jgi:23S rRNA (adenine2030-N6)-methyltransferase
VNYRHAFHAGNFADCVKHALLVALVSALQRKPSPFAVLDTHAGRGLYDLSSEAAERTGEWRQGIGRLADITAGPLAPWLALVRQAGFPPFYPGSPWLIRALLRARDRLILCEKHPEEAAVLRAALGRDARVAIHRRDGWEAIGALTPFAERRGLVLIDPPFEQPGEFDRLAEAFRLLHRRFRAGVVAAWYPIKHRAPVRAFADALREAGLRDILAAELWLREPTDPARLNGCGVMVMNPPYGFAAEAAAILSALLARLSDGEPGAGTEVKAVADE